MRFRPCIDLHQGRVKQIVGSTLKDGEMPAVNFESAKPVEWFVDLFKSRGLWGGHVIMLGPGNQEAAMAAVRRWPGGMQVGGGITAENAGRWLDAGACAVILTSWVFYRGKIDFNRLGELKKSVGKDRIVLDLSCSKIDGRYLVMTDRWQTASSEVVDLKLLERLSPYCHEFLIHAVDVEGRNRGVDAELAGILGRWDGIKITYAGGISCEGDLDILMDSGNGRLDFTVGSALDIFGGSGLAFDYLASRFAS